MSDQVVEPAAPAVGVEDAGAAHALPVEQGLAAVTERHAPLVAGGEEPAGSGEPEWPWPDEVRPDAPFDEELVEEAPPLELTPELEAQLQPYADAMFMQWVTDNAPALVQAGMLRPEQAQQFHAEQMRAARADDAAMIDSGQEAVAQLLDEWRGELGELDAAAVMAWVEVLHEQNWLRGVPSSPENAMATLRQAAEAVAWEAAGFDALAAQLEVEHSRYGEFDDRQVFTLAEHLVVQYQRRGLDDGAAAREAIGEAVRTVTGQTVTRARSISEGLAGVTRYHRQRASLTPPAPADRREFSRGPLGAVTAKHADAVRADARARGDR